MTEEGSEHQGKRDDLLRRHREVSETLRRTMLALLTFSLFCWLTAIGSSDRSLIVSEPTVEVPFINVTLSFPAFLILAPFLLIVFAIYLHVFFRERLELAAMLGDDKPSQAAMIFNFDTPAARFLTAFIFYWLVPITLGAIAWKALARPEWGLPMVLLMVVVTAALAYVRYRRFQGCARSRWLQIYYGGLVAIISFIIMLAAMQAPELLRRQLGLQRANLEGVWLFW